MSTYIVTQKSDGAEVTRYAAMTVQSGTWPLAEFVHTEFFPDAPPPPEPVATVLTKREFIKRFTVGEYAAIKAATAQNATLDYYWQMFMLAENITTTDADTIAGVTTLEQVGLLGAGRAQEVLNGQ